MAYDERTFHPVASSVREARKFVFGRLRALRATPEETDWAELVTSELASNAVIHAGTDYDVGVESNGQFVISVRDGSAAHPVLGAVGAEAEGGRGIAIIERTSNEWGVDDQTTGKRVWCATNRHHE